MFVKEAIELFCNNTAPCRAPVIANTVKLKPVQVCVSFYLVVSLYYFPITRIVFMKFIHLGKLFMTLFISLIYIFLVNLWNPIMIII